MAVAVLSGGLRNSRLAALGEAAVFAAVWLERPALGPAWPWLPWLAWAFLSAARSAQPLASLPLLARWGAVLAFYSVAAAWGEREREEWVKEVLAVTVILTAAAVWTGAGLGFRAEMTGLIPPYYNYTTFAVAAGVAAAAAWALHPGTKGRGARAAGLAAAAVGAACLILAHGRGAILGLGFAGLVWAARRWGAKAGLAALIAAGLAAGAFQARLIPDSWRAAVLQHGGRYKEGRLGIWRSAEETADEKPSLGEGPGNFGAAFRRHPAEAFGGAARWGLYTDYAHSEPLQAAAETGWVGLALWLIGMGAALSVLLGRAREEPAREAAAIALAAMAVHLVVDNMLQLPGLALLFFSAAAVAGPGITGGRRWPRAAVAAGALLALGAWIPRALADGAPARAAALFPREAYPREDLAYRAMSAGDLGRADMFWAEAEQRAPYDAVYPWRRAQIAAAQGRWDAAEILSGRAAALEPGFLNDRVLRAETLVRLGRSKSARAELAAVLRASVERGIVPVGPGYEKAVWDFNRGEYDRVAALAARAKH